MNTILSNAHFFLDMPLTLAAALADVCLIKTTMKHQANHLHMSVDPQYNIRQSNQKLNHMALVKRQLCVKLCPTLNHRQIRNLHHYNTRQSSQKLNHMALVKSKLCMKLCPILNHCQILKYLELSCICNMQHIIFVHFSYMLLNCSFIIA